jgi:hypothetical protein
MPPTNRASRSFDGTREMPATWRAKEQARITCRISSDQGACGTPHRALFAAGHRTRTDPAFAEDGFGPCG